jgi:hypothetical protein
VASSAISIGTRSPFLAVTVQKTCMVAV